MYYLNEFYILNIWHLFNKLIIYFYEFVYLTYLIIFQLFFVMTVMIACNHGVFFRPVVHSCLLIGCSFFSWLPNVSITGPTGLLIVYKLLHSI